MYDFRDYRLGHLYEGEYTPEKCQTLKMAARCPVDQGIVTDHLCQFEWLTHPLKYVRAKQRRRARDENNTIAEGDQTSSIAPQTNSQDNNS